MELANQGTVFLDEIGEMSPYLQAKLLRFLSDGSFRRVGGDREVKVDVRIISATHRDLERMVAEGTFREDLFYRLNVLNLQVPPLRDRGQDILSLAQYFMQQACTQIQRPHCRLAPATHPALLGNPWPGNVRQLQNVIFRAAAICESNVVDIGDLDIAGTSVARGQDGEVASLEQAVGISSGSCCSVCMPATLDAATGRAVADLAHGDCPAAAQVRYSRQGLTLEPLDLARPL